MNVARKRGFWLAAGVLFAVLVFVFAAGLVFFTSQSRWIQERRAYLAAHLPMPVVIVADPIEIVDDPPPLDTAPDAATADTPGVELAAARPVSEVLFSGTLVPESDAPRFPRFVLWMFGEAETGEFDLRFSLDDSPGPEVDRVRQLFPESTIRWSIMAP